MWPMPGNTATAQKRARRFSAAALHEVVLTTTRCRPGGEDALAGLRVILQLAVNHKKERSNHDEQHRKN
jgi:hypothetical protein